MIKLAPVSCSPMGVAGAKLGRAASNFEPPQFPVATLAPALANKCPAEAFRETDRWRALGEEEDDDEAGGRTMGERGAKSSIIWR